LLRELERLSSRPSAFPLATGDLLREPERSRPFLLSTGDLLREAERSRPFPPFPFSSTREADRGPEEDEDEDLDREGDRALLLDSLILSLSFLDKELARFFGWSGDTEREGDLLLLALPLFDLPGGGEAVQEGDLLDFPRAGDETELEREGAELLFDFFPGGGDIEAEREREVDLLCFLDLGEAEREGDLFRFCFFSSGESDRFCVLPSPGERDRFLLREESLE
jgi:hypothetical protein